MIKFSWRRGTKTFKPRQRIDPKLLELEIAKEILEEVSHARPSDVEDMIKRRLEEKSWSHESWREEDELWPASFGVGE